MADKPFFSNRLYDALKYVALVLLPALGALYFGLGQIWGLPKIEETVGTITIIDTFLGMLIRKSNQNYQASDERFDGHIDVTETAGDTTYELNVDGDPEKVLEEKDEVTFKVNTDETPVTVEEVPEVEALVAKTPAPRKRAPRKAAPKAE